MSGRTLDVPDAIGRYRVIRPIGRGGMGIVYLAEDPGLGRRVAIKMIQGDRVDAVELERFEREAKTLASIDHPCVATVYALESTPRGPAIVMEYVGGDTLSHRILQGEIGVQRSVSVMRHVARALEAVHARGIVHRDLKPANVMLMLDGRVKVLDFGLALDTRAEHASHSGVGTVGYMSPEQLRGEPLDARADLFALAAIAWECLAGAPAFPGDTDVARVAATMTRRPDPDRLPEELPPAIRDLLVRSLQPDIAARPATARAFLDAFAAVSDDSPTETRAADTDRAKATVPRLPADASSFVGREVEIRAITEHLSSSRLVTLTGVGGSGKTRLGIAVARRLLAAPADGVYFCELATATRSDHVATAFTSVLDVPELPGKSIEESLDQHLATREVLIVVDNCEHVLAAAAALTERILSVAPNVRVLATSRESLDVYGEVIFQVPPLGLPAEIDDADGEIAAGDAVALFVERARRHRPGFVCDESTAPAIVEICRRVDGIPLAIELAAARLRVLTVEEIAQRLGKRLRLLTGGARTAPARHRTLRAAIDWSCDQLSDEERALFHRLAVFVGGWTLEAAEAVCADDPSDADHVLECLARLVQKSLVEATPDGRETRYRLLECVHEYADEKLEGTERDLATERHLAYVHDLGRRAVLGYASPEQAAWLQRLGREHDNVRAAVAAAKRMGDLDRAVETACSLTRFWETRSRFVEGLAFLERLIVLFGKSRRDELYARLVNDTGLLAYAHGDDRLAKARYEEAFHVWRSLGNERRMAGSLNNLGLVTQRAGDLEGAVALFDQALAINRKRGNRSWESSNLSNRGFTYRDLGRFTEARRDLEEAVRILEDLGEDTMLAAACDNLGTLAGDEGKHAEARAYHERGLAIARKLKNPRAESVSLGNLGCLALEEGELSRARPLLCQSLRIKRELDAVLGIAHAMESFASLAIAEKRWKRAARLMAAGRAIRERLGTPPPAPDIAGMERALTDARAAAGEDAIARAWEEGLTLSLDDAIALALEEDRGAGDLHVAEP